MIALRFLTVLVFAALITGCDPDVKNIKDDIKLAKADIQALKAYLMAMPSPDSCGVPGTRQAKICYYKLKVEPFDKQRGLFKGYYAPSVVEKGEKECPVIKDSLVKAGHTEVQNTPCREAKHYKYYYYGFKIDGPTPDFKKDVEYEFISVPGTDYLRIGKAEEANVEKP